MLVACHADGFSLWRGDSPPSASIRTKESAMSGQGSAGNVIAAICSLFIPGLGQLLQGRVLSALVWFIVACIAFAITWVLTLSLLPFGWFLIAILSCINAALYRR
jgi:TM2 domain-containing membrane protein YozV